MKSAVITVIILVLSLAATAPEAAGPTKITACTTVTTSGSYLLDKDLTATGDCLVITACFTG